MNQTFISQSGGTGDAGDHYTGLDRFGRVVEQNWYNTSTQSSTDDFQYGYDQDGNVLYKNNMIDSIFSELYHTSGAGNGYDGLNQITGFARGALSASQQGGPLDTVSSPSTTESWALDALGNFTSVTLNGTPTSRTNNQQNEVTAVGSSNLTYDKNGNTITDDQGHTLTYDAWNQVVEVKNGNTVLDAYTIDGLGRRVTENVGTLTDIYFSKDWQVLEEDVSGSMQDQYVWSQVYVNAMIERETPTQRLYVQQDANWNVTALINTTGQVVERYVYDPYGAVTYLTANWSSESQSAYGWRYLSQGGRLDRATGLLGFQHRQYSPSLERWLESDPLGFRGGDSNLYRAEAGNPCTHVDPCGLYLYTIIFTGPSPFPEQGPPGGHWGWIPGPTGIRVILNRGGKWYEVTPPPPWSGLGAMPPQGAPPPPFNPPARWRWIWGLGGWKLQPPPGYQPPFPPPLPPAPGGGRQPPRPGGGNPGGGISGQGAPYGGDAGRRAFTQAFGDVGQPPNWGQGGGIPNQPSPTQPPPWPPAGGPRSGRDYGPGGGNFYPRP